VAQLDGELQRSHEKEYVLGFPDHTPAVARSVAPTVVAPETTGGDVLFGPAAFVAGVALDAVPPTASSAIIMRARRRRSMRPVFDVEALDRYPSNE
jgi:hypothetical protein